MDEFDEGAIAANADGHELMFRRGAWVDADGQEAEDGQGQTLIYKKGAGWQPKVNFGAMEGGMSPAPALTEFDRAKQDVAASPAPRQPGMLQGLLSTKDGQPSLLDKVNPASWALRQIPGLENTSPLMAAKEKLLDPTVEALQRNVGAPAMKVLLPSIERGAATLGGDPQAAVYNARQVGQFLTGDKLNDAQAAEGKQAANANRAANLGKHGPQIGDLVNEFAPVMAVPTPGRVTKVAGAAEKAVGGMVGKMAGGAVEGAAMAGGNAILVPGADPLEHALAGFGVGGALPPTLAAVGKVLSTGAKISQKTGAAIADLYLNAVGQQGVQEAGIKMLKEEAEAAVPQIFKLKTAPADFAPMFSTWERSPKGKLLRAYVEVASDGSMRTVNQVAGEAPKWDVPHYDPPEMMNKDPEMAALIVDNLLSSKPAMQKFAPNWGPKFAAKVVDAGDHTALNKSNVMALKRQLETSRAQLTSLEAEKIQKFSDPAVLKRASDVTRPEAGNVNLNGPASPVPLEYKGSIPLEMEVQLPKAQFKAGQRVQFPDGTFGTVERAAEPAALRDLEAGIEQGTGAVEDLPFKMGQSNVQVRREDGLVFSQPESALKPAPAPRKPPSLAEVPGPDGLPPGMLVHYGAAAGDGRAALGIYRGRVGGKYGKYAVETADGKILQLTQQEFNDARPYDFGDARLLQAVGKVPGLTEPMLVPMSPATQAAMEQAAAKLNIARQYSNGDPSVMEKLRDQVTNQYLFGQPLKREGALKMAAAEQAGASDALSIASFMSGTGGKSWLKFNPQLDRVIHLADPAARSKAWAEARKVTPELTKHFEDQAEALIKEHYELEAKVLGRLDAAENTLRLNLGTKDALASSLYANTGLRGVAAKTLRKGEDKWEAAIKAIGQEYQKQTGAALAPDQIDALLTEALSQGSGTKAAFRRNFAALSKGEKVGAVVPPGLEKMVGDLQSTALAFGHSLGALRTLDARMGFWDRVARTGEWARDARGPDWVKVPNTPEFGGAAGGYVAPGYAGLLRELPVAQSNFLTALNNHFKINMTTRSPSAHVNNFLRAARGGVLNGVLEEPGYMVKAWKQMRAAPSNPSKSGPAALFQEAKWNGVLESSQATADSALTDRALRNQVEREIEKLVLGGQDPMVAISNAAKDAAANYVKGTTKADVKLRQIYSLWDDWMKLASYMKRRDEGLGRGMKPDEAAAYAAQAVAETFPLYNIPTPAEQKLKNAAFLGGTFAHAVGQDYKVIGAVGGRAAKNPADMRRLMTYVALVGGSLNAVNAVRKANGVSDAEVDRTWAQQPESALAIRGPGVVAAPWTDAEGRLQFYNLGHSIEPLMNLTARAPDQNVAAAMVRNFAGELVSGGVLSQLGIGAPKPQSANPLKDFVLGSGVLPGAVSRVWRATDRTKGPLGESVRVTDEQWSPAQAAGYAAGLPFVGPLTNATTHGLATPRGIAAMKEAKTEYGKAKGQAKMWLGSQRKNEAGEITDETVQEYGKKVREASEDKMRRINRLTGK